MYKYPAWRVMDGVVWQDTLCLGRKNLGCIRFAFQEEGSWPGQAGQDGAAGNRDGEVRPTGCTVLCVYWNLGQGMRIRLEMGMGTRPDNETRDSENNMLRAS